MSACRKCGRVGHFARECKGRDLNSNVQNNACKEVDGLSSSISELKFQEDGDVVKVNNRSDDAFRSGHQRVSTRVKQRRRTLCTVCKKYGHSSNDCWYANLDVEQLNIHTKGENEFDRYDHSKRSSLTGFRSKVRSFHLDGRKQEISTKRGKSNGKLFGAFGPNDPLCYNCGKPGHISFSCPESGINRSKKDLTKSVVSKSEAETVLSANLD